MIDLSTKEKTLTHHVEALIPVMNEMDYADIKISMMEILIDMNDVSASSQTRQKWIDAIDRKRTKNDLMMMITNLYLAGCDLKTLK